MFSYASRCLMAEGMGRVSFYTSVANYALMLGSLGISTYGIRKVAQSRSDIKHLTKIIEELFLLNVFFTSCVVCILLIISFFVPRLNEDLGLLSINCLYVMLAPLGMDWAYSGLEQYRYITIRSFICKLCSLILLFLLVHDKNDYFIYACIVVFAATSSWIINFVHIRKFISSIYGISEIGFRQHIKPMLLLFSSLLAVSIYTNVDTIMLGFIGSDEQVGYYTVATRIKSVLLSLVNSVSAVLLPRMSFYLKNGDEDLFKSTVKRSISVIFFMAVPVMVFFEISAKEAIFILGGEGYEPAIIIMQIIMPILIISGFSNITGNQILIPQGKDFAFMQAVSFGAVIDIILNVIFMPRLLAVGAAIATLLAEVVQMSIQVRHSKEYLRKNVDYLYIFKLIIFSTIIGTLVSLLLLKVLIVENYVLGFALKGILFFGLYGILLFVTKDRIFVELLNEVNNMLRLKNINKE